MSFSHISSWLEYYPNVAVEITGGEPLLQENIYPFFDLLLEDGRTVLVETNGSLSIAKIPSQVSVILDIKCPDSGMSDKMDWQNLPRLYERKKKNSRDDVKFVISSEKDFFWAKKVIEEHDLEDTVTILFSPVEYLFAPSILAELLMEYRLRAKLQLQLHRLLWPEKDRGF
jgi:7-carboxy-7-deazaguanine synthase